jgi:large subunit ribosomal protein L18e
MRTGPNNEQLKALIQGLKEKSYSENSALLKRIATDLERPSRNRRAVNLSRINRFTKAGETIVVPGKVLASGELNHALTIAAWQFSGDALEKIAKSKSKAIPISELLNGGIKGKKVRVIG